MTGKYPREALHLIDRLGLYSVIFTDPTKEPPCSPATENWKLVYDCLETLQRNKTPGSIYDTLVRSEDAQFVAWILAAVAPWSSVPLPEAKVGAKIPLPYATLVGREGIKVNNKISDIITASFRNSAEITTLRDAILEKYAYVNERDTVGMMIRRWDWTGKNWRLEVMLAIFVEVLNKGQAGKFHPERTYLSPVQLTWYRDRLYRNIRKLANLHRSPRSHGSHERAYHTTKSKRRPTTSST